MNLPHVLLLSMCDRLHVSYLHTRLCVCVCVHVSHLTAASPGSPFGHTASHRSFLLGDKGLGRLGGALSGEGGTFSGEGGALCGEGGSLGFG